MMSRIKLRGPGLPRLRQRAMIQRVTATNGWADVPMEAVPYLDGELKLSILEDPPSESVHPTIEMCGHVLQVGGGRLLISAGGLLVQVADDGVRRGPLQRVTVAIEHQTAPPPRRSTRRSGRHA